MSALERKRARSRQWNAANKDKRRETERRYRARHKEKLRIAAALARSENPEKYREINRRSKGLPNPTRSRPSACENCGRDARLEVSALALDHDHTTGQFRGWLCMGCNTGLGLLGDSREGLLRTLAYLDRAT